MSIQEFIWPVNIVFTEKIGWNTLVTTYEDGKEQRRAKWSQPKRRYEISLRGKTDTVMSQVWSFYNARQGAYDTFYFENPNENPVTDERIGSGDASQTVFSLDNYPLPSGSITVRTATTNFTETTHYTLARSTGTVTFNVAPSGDLYSTYEFCRIVRFEEDNLERQLFNYKLYNSSLKLIQVL